MWFVCLLSYARAFLSSLPPFPSFAPTLPHLSQHSADPIGSENEESEKCATMKKSCVVLPASVYQPRHIFPFDFPRLLEFTVVWIGTLGLTLFQIPSLIFSNMKSSIYHFNECSSKRTRWQRGPRFWSNKKRVAVCKREPSGISAVMKLGNIHNCSVESFRENLAFCAR